MSDCMAFPNTVEEFMESYKIVDTEQIYTNGAELVPIFRMKQWFEHLESAQPDPQWIPCSERLPEEDQYNLVTMQHANGEIDVVIARLVKPYSKKVPWEWESDDSEGTWSFENGFAWMPLPEPYKGDE